MLGKGNFLLCIPLLHLQHPVISRGSVQTPWNGSQGGNSLGWVLKGGVWRGWDPPKVPPWVFFQAPTERQLRYKEKVAELRKKRNSGLSKEQKEKYMVKTRDFILSFPSKDGICLLWSSCSIPSWKKTCRIPQLSSQNSCPLLSQEHRQTYGNTREPLLENLTSEYDLELFRRAQARASEDLVRPWGALGGSGGQLQAGG